MPITVRDQVGVPPPPTWKPAPCFDPPVDMWAGIDVPWRTDITAWTVDRVRTANLTRTDVNVPVDMEPPTGVWDGSVGGMPLQDARNLPMTPIWDLARPVTWEWFRPIWPIVQVPLPAVVRREGDPMGAWDQHHYSLDVDRGRLYELILVDNSPWNRWRTWGQADWTAGYSGGGPGIARWDLTRPWTAPGQPHGIVAASVPHAPHFVRADEVTRGRIGHALFMALANYAPGKTGYARGSDGSKVDHPCRAGERLRLPRTAVDWFPVGTPERVVALALATFGLIVGDRSDHSGSATSKPGKIACTQDPRLASGWKGLGLRLADFEVVQP